VNQPPLLYFALEHSSPMHVLDELLGLNGSSHPMQR